MNAEEPSSPRVVSIVLASNNHGKLAELRALLTDLPVQLLSLDAALGRSLHVVEDGDTFQANATLKARAACEASGLIALADDSGLEVRALGGRPGVRSARFAHEHATDAENNAALLAALEGVEDRAARFRCVLALARPGEHDVRTTEGTCTGTIAHAPRGSGGFGYDPLFLVDSMGGRAMAELTDAEKNAVSHRGHAMQAMRDLLSPLLG